MFLIRLRTPRIHSWEYVRDFCIGGEFGLYVSKTISFGVKMNIIASEFRNGFGLCAFGEWNKEICTNVYYSPRLNLGYLERKYGEDFYGGYLLSISLVGLNCQITDKFIIRLDIVNAINETIKNYNIKYTRLEFSPLVTFRRIR